MPAALLFIAWDSKIGAILQAKVPVDFADAYTEDLNTEIMRIFTAHALGEADAGFSSLTVKIGGEEYKVASYYTGIVREEEQYCVSLLLQGSEDPKAYEGALTSIVPGLVNAVAHMTADEFQHELELSFRKIIRLAGMTDESRLARLFTDEVARAVWPKLWRGGISKEDMTEWLKMVTGLASISIDSVIAPFEVLGLVKEEWVDEVGRTCLFLVSDIDVLRAPPLTSIENANTVLDPDEVADYKKMTKEFLEEWQKTPEDTIAIAEILSDPDTYDILTILRERPHSLSEIEARVDMPARDLKAAIQKMLKYRVITEIRKRNMGGEYEKWYLLLTDIRIRRFWPEYFISSLIQELEKNPEDKKAIQMANQHLRLLRESYPR